MDSGLDQLKKLIATNKQANQQKMANPITSLTETTTFLGLTLI